MKANDFLPRHCVVLAATTCLNLLFVFHCPENCFQSRPPQPQKHFCLFLQMGTERLNCDTWLNSMAGTLFVFFCQEDSFKAPSPNSNEHLKFFFYILNYFCCCCCTFLQVFKWYQSTEYYVVLQESKGTFHITFIAVSRFLQYQYPVVNTNKQKTNTWLPVIWYLLQFVHRLIFLVQLSITNSSPLFQKDSFYKEIGFLQTIFRVFLFSALYFGCQ